MNANDIIECWFERTSDGLMHKAYAGCRNDISYSGEIFTKRIDIFRHACRYAKSVLSTIGLGKFMVRLDKRRSFTDFKTINVSTDYFDSPNLSMHDKMDIFLGLCIHEASHILYTDRNEMSETNIVKMLANIIEDERIEQLMCGNNPGFACFLFKSRYHYFDKKPEKMSFFMTILCLIRFPKYVTDNIIDMYADKLVKVKDILNPFPRSTKESFKAARRIYELLENVNNENSNDNDNSDNNDSGELGSDSVSGVEANDESDEKSEYDSGGHEENGELHDRKDEGDNKGHGKPGEKGDRAEKHQEESEKEENGEKDDKDSGRQSDEHGGDDSDDGEKYSFDSSEAEKILSKLCDDDIHESKQIDPYDIDIIQDDIVEENGCIFDYVNPDIYNVEAYSGILSKIKPYISPIRKKLVLNSESYTFVHKCQKTGFLNKNRLVEAVHGVPTVYCRHGAKNVQKGDVIILIDESGSMNGEKIRRAGEMAVLIYESMKDIPNINLYIYGHSTTFDSDTRNDIPMVYIYTENSKFDRYKMGAITAKNNNMDGYAILGVAKRVCSMSSNNTKMMFVISDGAPSARGYSGESAVTNTKECVDKVESMGIDIMQIAIESVKSDLMFKKYVKYKTLDDFTLNFTRMVQKNVLDKLKSRIL